MPISTSGKQRVLLRPDRIGRKRPLHHTIGIGIAAAGKDVRTDLRFKLHLRALRAECQGVHARAAIAVLNRRRDRRAHADQRQRRAAYKFDLVPEFVVEVKRLHQQALIENCLLHAAVVAPAGLSANCRNMVLRDEIGIAVLLKDSLQRLKLRVQIRLLNALCEVKRQLRAMGDARRPAAPENMPAPRGAAQPYRRAGFSRYLHSTYRTIGS